MPIVAAALGVLGGMGGAFIGGNVANEGQQQRFHDEQTVRMRDLKREAYAEHVKACGNVVLEGTLTNIAKVHATEARVVLFTSSIDVRQAASKLSHEALKSEVSSLAYAQARDSFVEAAEPEIAARE